MLPWWCLAWSLLALASAEPTCDVVEEVPTGPRTELPERIPMPETVLMVGSSSIEWGLGPAIAGHLKAAGVQTVVNAGRRSTGLARLDFHDWLTQAHALTAQHSPGLVIVQLGGNDAQHLRTPQGKRVANWGSADWIETYANRIRSLLSALRHRGAQVAVIGLTHPEDPTYAHKVARINAAWSLVSAEQHAWFLGTWAETSAPDGGPATHAEMDGTWRRLRLQDGIHLGRYGSRWLAARLSEDLTGRLDRRSECTVAPLPTTSWLLPQGSP